MKNLPAAIVDFHVHLFPDRMFDAIWSAFERLYGWKVLHHLYHRECIASLRERGVETIVYSNYAHRPGVAAGLNEWNGELLDAVDGLYCYAAYCPDDPDALRYAERILGHPKVLGIKLQLLVQRFYPHDRRLYPLYEMIVAKRKRLLFHVGTGPVGNEFVGYRHFRELLRDFPALPATVAHMGALEYRDFMGLLDDHPALYLDTAYAFLGEGLPGGFDLGNDLLERYRDRILYGSDYPNVILPREVELTELLRRDLSQEFYDRVFYANGMRLIGETSPAARYHMEGR